MKILYVADMHLRTLKPVNRIDEDYFQVQFNKLKQIKDFIKKNKIKYLFIGGDIFDISVGSMRLLVEVMKFFTKLSKLCEIYTIVGNHDFIGANLNTLNKVCLGVLFASERVKKLDELELNNLYIKGIDYRIIPDLSDYELKKLSPGNSKLKRIIISHDMITPHASFPFEVLPVNKIKTSADLILCSHYHMPFVKKVKDTTFLNPGSLMRIRLIEENTKRTPQMLLIDLTGNKIQYEFIKLKVCKGNEVFDIEGKKESIQDELRLEEFFTSLSSINRSLKQFDVETALRRLRKEKSVDDGIFTEALDRIQSAKSAGEQGGIL